MIETQISNYIHVKQWDVITHPRPNFNGDLVEPSLKLGHVWFISSHKNMVTITCLSVR